MAPARQVIVGQDDDVRAGELLGIGFQPLAGSARIARCRESQSLKGQCVLLALDDINDPTLGDCCLDLWEPEEVSRYALDVPDPLGAIRRDLTPALAEALGPESHNLIRELALSVGVVVGGDDPTPCVSG